MMESLFNNITGLKTGVFLLILRSFQEHIFSRNLRTAGSDRSSTLEFTPMFIQGF